MQNQNPNLIFINIIDGNYANQNMLTMNSDRNMNMNMANMAAMAMNGANMNVNNLMTMTMNSIPKNQMPMQSMTPYNNLYPNQTNNPNSNCNNPQYNVYHIKVPSNVSQQTNTVTNQSISNPFSFKPVPQTPKNPLNAWNNRYSLDNLSINSLFNSIKNSTPPNNGSQSGNAFSDHSDSPKICNPFKDSAPNSPDTHPIMNNDTSSVAPKPMAMATLAGTTQGSALNAITIPKCVSHVKIAKMEPILSNRYNARLALVNNISNASVSSNTPEINNGYDSSNSSEMGQYKCDKCSKCFCHASNMKVHQKIHSSSAYQCSFCCRKFARYSNLQQHLRVHTNERPFKCWRCGKGFKQSHSLSDHVRLHTGEKPFKCDLCGKRFTVKHNMVVHRRIHTGEKPYQCSHCSKKFSSKSGLNQHSKIHR